MDGRSREATAAAVPPLKGGQPRKPATRPVTPARVPIDKDGKPRCANCGRTGHDKDACRQKKLDRSKRPCFECGEPGHMAFNCPKKAANAHNVEREDQDEEDVMMAMMREAEAEEPWQGVPKRRSARAAPLCVPRGPCGVRCNCGRPEVPVTPSSFEVLGSDSDSDSDSDSEMAEMGFSSSEENFEVGQA